MGPVGKGVQPAKGGDARGCKRLLEWRADLLYGLASEEGKAEYEEFTADLETIPAGERVQRVLDGGIAGASPAAKVASRPGLNTASISSRDRPYRRIADRKRTPTESPRPRFGNAVKKKFRR